MGVVNVCAGKINIDIAVLRNGELILLHIGFACQRVSDTPVQRNDVHVIRFGTVCCCGSCLHGMHGEIRNRARKSAHRHQRERRRKAAFQNTFHYHHAPFKDRGNTKKAAYFYFTTFIRKCHHSIG